MRSLNHILNKRGLRFNLAITRSRDAELSTYAWYNPGRSNENSLKFWMKISSTLLCLTLGRKISPSDRQWWRL